MTSCLRLKKSNCKNCYKCIRHCPVKSIRFSAEQAHIIDDECILCGQCFVVCPQDAKQIVDETEKVKVLIGSGEPVIASLAPSFIANYDGVGIESMREALKKLGFHDVEETAIGATMVKREYDRMLRDENRDIVISSCCHSINLLIRKYFPEQLPYLADVVSPMVAHCIDIKRRIPNAKTVFIGPCVAKKDEADQHSDVVDAALTFEELTSWLKEEQIELKKEVITDDMGLARFFPTPGGILKTMAQDAPGFTYMALDGIDACLAALDDIAQGKIHKCFIEMSTCSGSCIGGPVMEKYRRSPVADYMAVANFAGKNDFDVDQPDVSTMKQYYSPIDRSERVPSNYEIVEILRQMGKFKPSDELNCGSCGYNTCRDKAVAIYQGKADVSMCLPFLKEKAESFSDAIVKNSPNALVVVNDTLEVQQLNDAALKLLNIRFASDVLGDQVVRILDPKAFLDVKRSRRGVYNKRTYLAEYDRYVDQTIVPAEDGRMIICIMHDVTAEEEARQRKEEISHQTVEVADEVINRQMLIVQEIASLLGETTAETKIALSKLKESIIDE
ncbi:MAG: 4Fe-4S binding protein [Atopobiaceae bacterium]|nr:4Fe-4S binding protein [Atopobiaceae bacterium]